MKNNRLVIIQYNKVRDTINSCKTIEQLQVCQNMIKVLSNWWVSEQPLIKPFDFKYISEPNKRISELENLHSNKCKELVNYKI